MIIDNLFLGVGAMKAGTTWVYKLIEKHPDIYFSYEKEIHYFAEIDLNLNPLSLGQRYTRFQDATKVIDSAKLDAFMLRHKLMWYASYLSEPVDDSWYLNLFSHRGQQKYCTDFSNLYCHLDSKGWQHVRTIAKNIKAIYILRNPWERLWSHIRFHCAIVGEFDNLKNWNKHDVHAFATKKHMWINTEYSKSVKSLRHNLSYDEHRIYFFEDIHLDQEKWLKELEGFLEIGSFEYDEQLLNSKINVSAKLQMPHFFPDLFREVFEKEIDELERLGLDIPDSWSFSRYD